MRALVLTALLVAGLAEAKLKVVATVGDLAALAREVGGADAEVALLARPSQDPHFVDARPSLVLLLARADLLVLNGMELETGWLPTLLTSSRNGKIQRGSPGYFDASTAITPLEVPAGKIDRSMGDIHPGGNPHYAVDPRRAVQVAKALAQKLAALDAEHSSEYLRRASEFETAIAARMVQWRERLAPYQGTLVVPHHRSWIYFVDFAGMVEAGYVEPKPGLPPSNAHVAQVLATMRARKVKLILQENWYSAAVAELLAQKSGAKLVRVPGQATEGQGYLDRMQGLVDAVLAALGSP